MADNQGGLVSGFSEIAKVASDYINNGMGQKGQYEAVRDARRREQLRDSEKKSEGSKPYKNQGPMPGGDDSGPQTDLPGMGDAEPKTGGSESA